MQLVQAKPPMREEFARISPCHQTPIRLTKPRTTPTSVKHALSPTAMAPYPNARNEVPKKKTTYNHLSMLCMPHDHAIAGAIAVRSERACEFRFVFHKTGFMTDGLHHDQGWLLITPPPYPPRTRLAEPKTQKKTLACQSAHVPDLQRYLQCYC